MKVRPEIRGCETTRVWVTESFRLCEIYKLVLLGRELCDGEADAEHLKRNME